MAMTNKTLETTGNQRLVDTVDGVLFDLDGVVYRGDNAVGHAVESIQELDSPVGYITNNASRSGEHVANHLRFLGLATGPEDVTTSAQTAANLIKEEYSSKVRVLMIGGAGLHHALVQAGLTVVTSADDSPDVVVQGTSQDLTWQDLAEAVYAINAGAQYVATNLDATMPTERGIALGNGALVQAVIHATGVSPAHAAGKPDPEIFFHAAQRGGMSRPLVVGDRLDTDIAGARAAGFASLAVLTGVSGVRDIILAEPSQRPDYVAADLRGLLMPHQAPQHTSRGWECGEVCARISHGEITVETPSGTINLSEEGKSVKLTIDGVRAACAAAWSHSSPITWIRNVELKEDHQ